MDRDLDKLVDAEIEYLQELNYFRQLYNYEDEMANAEEFCCDECQGQAAYYLRGRGNV